MHHKESTSVARRARCITSELCIYKPYTSILHMRDCGADVQHKQIDLDRLERLFGRILRVSRCAGCHRWDQSGKYLHISEMADCPSCQTSQNSERRSQHSINHLMLDLNWICICKLTYLHNSALLCAINHFRSGVVSCRWTVRALILQRNTE